MFTQRKIFSPLQKFNSVACICSGKVNVKMLSKCQGCLEQGSCQGQVALEVEGISFRSVEVLSLLGAHVNWTKRPEGKCYSHRKGRDTYRERGPEQVIPTVKWHQKDVKNCSELTFFHLNRTGEVQFCMVRWWFAPRWERLWVRAVIWKVFREGNASILCFVSRHAGSQGHGSE